MNFFESVWDNIQKTGENIANIFSLGTEQFAGGDWLGGVASYAEGVFVCIGNTVTLTGANAISTQLSDGFKDNDVLEQTVDANGLIQYKVKEDANVFEQIVGGHVASKANNNIRQLDEIEKGNVMSANAAGAKNLLSDALTAVSVACGVHTVASVGTKIFGAAAAAESTASTTVSTAANSAESFITKTMPNVCEKGAELISSAGTKMASTSNVIFEKAGGILVNNAEAITTNAIKKVVDKSATLIADGTLSMAESMGDYFCL